MLQKDILDYYEQTKNANKTARHFGISPQTVRRALITNGLYLSERNKEVARLRLMGFTIEEIAEYLHISEKAVKNHLPYTKGSYVTKDKTENAIKIAASRAKKKAKALEETKEEEEEDDG